jgi:hypothetical protein
MSDNRHKKDHGQLQKPGRAEKAKMAAKATIDAIDHTASASPAVPQPVKVVTRALKVATDPGPTRETIVHAGYKTEGALRQAPQAAKGMMQPHVNTTLRQPQPVVEKRADLSQAGNAQDMTKLQTQNRQRTEQMRPPPYVPGKHYGRERHQ